MVTLALKKHLSSIGLEFGPNNAFIAFGTPLPSAILLVRFGCLLADCNGRFAHFLKNFKPTKEPMKSAAGCHT
jgi:hypothetical protein